MEGGVNEGRSVSNCTPGTNGIVPGTSRIVRTLIPVTTGTPDKSTLSQCNAHDLDEPRRTTSRRNYSTYSTEGGVAGDRSALDGTRLVLGVLTGRTDITPCLVSTSDESADSRPKSRGRSIGRARFASEGGAQTRTGQTPPPANQMMNWLFKYYVTALPGGSAPPP